MSLDTPRRGRPKGSGIDDQKYLKEIAALIAAKPGLKPTTAIRSLGITDPSAIRRLRDKFHQFAADCAIADHAAASEPSSAKPAPRHMAADVSGASDRRQEQPAGRTPSDAGKHTLDAQSACAEPHSPSLSTPSSIPTAVDLFAMWYGMGISAMSTALATQAAMTRNLARMPHVGIALRQQVAWNEMAMSFVAMRPAARTTLH